MNKIWLIIKREYLTRVRNKTFILSTFLTPLLFAGIIAIVVFITVKNSDKEKIAVIDNSGVFKLPKDSVKSVVFVLNPSVALEDFDKNGFSGILFGPNSGSNKTDSFQLYARKNFGVMTEATIHDKISKEIENDLLKKRFNIVSATVDSIKKESSAIKFGKTNIIGEDEKLAKGNSSTAYAIGYAASFLIYITLFIYGSMVMRGVMEEKTNRIAEVVVSSVKPFQLMMGKIIGIGAVGLTQFLMWIILVTVLSSLIGLVVTPEVLEQVNEVNKGVPMAQMNTSSNDMAIALAKVGGELTAANIWLIVGCFLFYFLFGYLFYAALFAAVGSAVNEDPQDAQSLMFPITMPIVLAIVIMINAITHPESALATWSSMIPFFSPIVMMARIPFGVPGTVPYWQLALSMLSLIGGFLFTTWLSAKIYRTAILMYGKKVTWKEMWKWAFRKY